MRKFRELAKLARICDVAYEVNEDRVKVRCVEEGVKFIALATNGDSSCLCVEWDGQFVAAHQGTEVTHHINPRQWWDDLNPFSTDLGNGAEIRSGAYEPLCDLYRDKLCHILPKSGIVFAGHSLGGAETFGDLTFSDNPDDEFIAFAPFKVGNRQFYKEFIVGRNLTIVGNEDDFALDYPEFSCEWVLPENYPILHLTPPSYSLVNPWPVNHCIFTDLFSGVPAHSLIDRYIPHLERLS